MATKNAEILAEQLTKQVDSLTKQNQTFQEQLNENLAKVESLTRDLGTQQEIMKQFEISKREYVAKLRLELDTVEERFHKVINENNMIGEDIRAQALRNLQLWQKEIENVEKEKQYHAQTTENFEAHKRTTEAILVEYGAAMMEIEDYRSRMYYKCIEFDRLDKESTDVIAERNTKRVEMSRLKEQVKILEEELSRLNGGDKTKSGELQKLKEKVSALEETNADLEG